MNKQELHEKYQDEKVMVIKDELISHLIEGPFSKNKILVQGKKYQIPLRTYIRTNMTPMLRADAENDIQYRQVITYVAIKDVESGDYFCTKRLAGDDRLTNQYSVGIGGHVEPDEDLYDGMYREIKEEIGLDSKDIDLCVFKGYLYDNSEPVSSVHVGLVFVATASKDKVEVIEKHKLSGEWLSMRQLEKYQEKGKLEGWSEIVLRYVLR